MKKKRMQEGLLLLEDIVNLGRKGEIVRAKAGFAWNFLLPQKKAVIADDKTISLQEQLKKEREAQAIEDKKQAEAVSQRLKGQLFMITVKSDSSGHLYGSVGGADIIEVLRQEAEIEIEKRSVLLSKPIKTTGVYTIQLLLRENVPATFTLKVKGDGDKQQESLSHIEVVEEGEEKETEEDSSRIDSEEETSLEEELENRTKNEEKRQSL